MFAITTLALFKPPDLSTKINMLRAAGSDHSSRSRRTRKCEREARVGGMLPEAEGTSLELPANGLAEKTVHKSDQKFDLFYSCRMGSSLRRSCSQQLTYTPSSRSLILPEIPPEGANLQLQ